MNACSTIQFLLHYEIDKVKWNESINQSANGLIYHYSFYLDAIAPNWDALIASDYSWVLPLPHKKKYGINYLYQPAFTQQLGIVAKPGIHIPINEIVNQLQQHYKFWEVQWTNVNTVDLPTSIIIKPATNFILDLKEGYENIAANFTRDLQRNLKRAMRFKYQYENVQDFSSAIDFYKKHYGKRIPHVKEKDYKAFENICLYAAGHQQLFCRQITNDNKEILAIALLLFDGSRLYNMMNTTTAAGRKTEANYLLFDSILKEFSYQPIHFDFEGSDLPGVHSFYKNFGPVNQPYLMVKYNNLPWPINRLKN